MGPSTGGWILYRTLAAPRLAAEPVVLIEPYAAETGEDVRMSRQEYQDWVAQEPSATAWTTAGHGNPRTPRAPAARRHPRKARLPSMPAFSELSRAGAVWSSAPVAACAERHSAHEPRAMAQASAGTPTPCLLAS